MKLTKKTLEKRFFIHKRKLYTRNFLLAMNAINNDVLKKLQGSIEPPNLYAMETGNALVAELNDEEMTEANKILSLNDNATFGGRLYKVSEQIFGVDNSHYGITSNASWLDRKANAWIYIISPDKDVGSELKVLASLINTFAGPVGYGDLLIAANEYAGGHDIDFWKDYAKLAYAKYQSKLFVFDGIAFHILANRTLPSTIHVLDLFPMTYWGPIILSAEFAFSDYYYRQKMLMEATIIPSDTHIMFSMNYQGNNRSCTFYVAFKIKDNTNNLEWGKKKLIESFSSEFPRFNYMKLENQPGCMYLLY